MVSEASSALPPQIASILQWANRIGLWRKLAVTLAIAALVSSVTTYGVFSSWGPFGRPDPQTVIVLLYIDILLSLLLSAVVVRHLVQLWLERRRGLAGSRLHSRLVGLFSVVAVTPAIIVAVFSVLYLNFGIESWFSDRVRTALDESLGVAEAYLKEHRQIIRADALAMANDINRSGPALAGNATRFNRFIATQAAIRSLTEVMVFQGDGRVLGRTGLTFSLSFSPLSQDTLESARSGEAVIVTGDTDDRVRALVRLDSFIDTYLFVGRFVDSRAIARIERTQSAVSEYKRLEGERSGIQITFALTFGVVTLLLLLAAVWLGLTFATQLAWPISNLIAAAERVRGGDLTARVDEGADDDEIGILSRAFNRMTDQLEYQRDELISANRQIDARRRFTESVLSGVSAGVIGLDSKGRIELPNRSALILLSRQGENLTGHKLSEVMPEMASLIKKAMKRPSKQTEDQLSIVREGRTRNLFVRISAERLGAEVEGFVVTIDDITALVAAQRKAAWADVARRIAHEIKNPLTPIQLSAERIKRKYLKEIKSDPEVFTMCTDTIVRHVSDIGRMIDEFSAFARMPAPVFKLEDVVDLVRQAVGLQEVAYPGIAFVKELPDRPVKIHCDGRQVVQVLTNVLQNAAESIQGRDPIDVGELEPGRIVARVNKSGKRAIIEVSDNGRGFPDELRERLIEPYITTRAKGTGLGLAIVKKIMEDHGGELLLEDGPLGGARVRLVFNVGEQISAATPDEADRVKTVTHGA